ncbi:MAG: xanthine dehydrogenase, partial [Gammaproteobacteria bacterium]|nr:xanthine dehydrogenase [Gammaproteobacteria bacterium]
MRPALLDTLLEAQRSGRSVVLATRLSDGAQELVEIGPAGAREPRTIAGVSADQVYAALRAEEAQVAETADGPVLLRPYTVPRRLLVVGAVHIAQVLARTSSAVGPPATIIDPPEGPAPPDRSPGAELVRAWPDQALERIGLDARSALVVLAHDPKIDDPA